MRRRSLRSATQERMLQHRCLRSQLVEVLMVRLAVEAAARPMLFLLLERRLLLAWLR